MYAISFQVGPDGTFRVDDLEPGEYWGSIRSFKVDAASPFGEDQATSTFQFTIPPIPGGRTDEPLDVGAVVVTVLASFSPGDEAPDLQLARLDKAAAASPASQPAKAAKAALKLSD